MSVMLVDGFQGIEFDWEIRVQGFDYAVVLDTLDHIYPTAKEGRGGVALRPHVLEWVEAECSGEALLAMERDDFLIVFNDPTDETLFRIRFTA